MLRVLAVVNIVNSAAVNLGVCNVNPALKNRPLGLQALESLFRRVARLRSAWTFYTENLCSTPSLEKCPQSKTGFSYLASWNSLLLNSGLIGTAVLFERDKSLLSFIFGCF